jgi:isopentenyl-diphosphate delta-isomerase
LENLEKTTGNDPHAAGRKQDHIELAFQSQVGKDQIDPRFYYEPLLAAHPAEPLPPVVFLGKTIQTPIWVSSMTGGTEKAYFINANLARACKQFGMGMGLGSCRALLDSRDRFKDFDFRNVIGDELPFYANIGIAQLEKLIEEDEVFRIDQLIVMLQADGVIIHVNPLQEWLQPEGDRITRSPIDTIRQFMQQTNKKVIVKEVGQGMGKESLRALMRLPLQAIEFAAHGGTNFSKLELLRNDPVHYEVYKDLSLVGHTAGDMVAFINEILAEDGKLVQCDQFIISGGIKHFIDGYYLMNKLQAGSVYGQASTLLKYAERSYEELEQFLTAQVEGLKLANAFLKVR